MQVGVQIVRGHSSRSSDQVLCVNVPFRNPFAIEFEHPLDAGHLGQSFTPQGRSAELLQDNSFINFSLK